MSDPGGAPGRVALAAILAVLVIAGVLFFLAYRQASGEMVALAALAAVDAALPEAESRPDAAILREAAVPAAIPEMDKRAAALVFKREQAAVRRCFEEELRRNPTVRERMTLELTVDAQGRVSEGQVHNASSPGFSTCLLDQARRWSFEPTGRIERAAYPITIQPR